MNYRRVTHVDHLVIKTCLDLGLTQSEIAVKTDFDQSMISREINRNRGSRGYRPRQATRRAMERQSYRMLPRKMRGKTRERIEEKLREKGSPEAISHRLKEEGLASV
jgi:transposase, IS30 family